MRSDKSSLRGRSAVFALFSLAALLAVTALSVDVLSPLARAFARSPEASVPSDDPLAPLGAPPGCQQTFFNPTPITFRDQNSAVPNFPI